MPGTPKLASAMQETLERRRDLALLISLLLVILLHPLLDQGVVGKSILSLVTFAPLIMATVRMSKKRHLLWVFVPLVLGSGICRVLDFFFVNEFLTVLRWTLVTAAFGLSVLGLFSYLRNASRVTADHLYTATSIYLLIAMTWYAMYSAIGTAYPQSIVLASGQARTQADLLYFSLITLTTVGYGDILPGSGIVRMLAALEAVAGILYIAITVALLVSAYKQPIASFSIDQIQNEEDEKIKASPSNSD
jgi:hypothetical protein